MELRGPSNLLSKPSFAEINEKYARIIDKSNLLVQKSQRMKNEDLMFKTHSYERLDNIAPDRERNHLGGNLFISGSSAPVCVMKEK